MNNTVQIREVSSFPVTGEVRAVGGGSGRVVWLLSDGAVMEKIGDGAPVLLFDTAENVNYDDGGFDPNGPAAIYVKRDCAAVVNRHGRHGFVNTADYTLHLFRDNEHIAHTDYPIGFFLRNDSLHLAFAEGWNHLQIAELSTRRVLTAAKSRVEEGAEERHIAYYREHEERNLLLWPREYDYFYGTLRVSPSGRHLLSCGWVWGSFDSLTVYDIDDFIENPRIRESVVFVGEHLSRKGCFVNDETVAVPVKPDLDDFGYDGGDEVAWEVRLYDLDGGELLSVPVPGLNLAGAELACVKGILCLWGREFGFAAVDPAKQAVIFRDEDFCPAAYDGETQRFLTAEDGIIGVWELRTE